MLGALEWSRLEGIELSSPQSMMMYWTYLMRPRLIKNGKSDVDIFRGVAYSTRETLDIVQIEDFPFALFVVLVQLKFSNLSKELKSCFHNVKMYIFNIFCTLGDKRLNLRD